MRYFLGIDGGGTKTHALIADETGKLHGFGKAGCGNFEVFGWERAKNEILKAADDALKQAGVKHENIAFAFFGLAGEDTQHDHVFLREEIKKLALFKNVKVKNDSFAALRGGTPKPYGVVVVSGTGTVAVGRNQEGKEHRAGGLGSDFGDLGSGPDILKMAISAVVRENDGRGQKTQLTQKMLTIFSCTNTTEWIDQNYRSTPNPEQMIQVIQAVYESAAKKDKAAQRIVKTIAEEIALSALAVIKCLNMQKETFDVVLAGSIHKQKGKILMPLISQRIHRCAPNACIRYPELPPVAGSVILAMEENGIPMTTKRYANIKKTMNRMPWES